MAADSTEETPRKPKSCSLKPVPQYSSFHFIFHYPYIIPIYTPNITLYIPIVSFSSLKVFLWFGEYGKYLYTGMLDGINFQVLIFRYWDGPSLENDGAWQVAGAISAALMRLSTSYNRPEVMGINYSESKKFGSMSS